MATPFSGQILWPSPGFTFAAGSVAVCNLYMGNKNLSSQTPRNSMFVYLSLNGVDSIWAALNGSNPHFGPFVFSAGDTLTFTPGSGIGILNANALQGGASGPPIVGINGEYYPPFATKTPFSVLIQENSSNYIVPAGKIARFMAFGADFSIAINGVDVATATQPGTAFTFLYLQPIGPLLADAGSVISVSHALVQAPQNPGVAFLNGWLFNK